MPFASNRKFLLRTTLVVPFVFQIVAAVGLTGWLSFINGQKAVNDLATQLRSEATARVEQRLNNYLKIPHLINQINADDVRLGKLNLQNTTLLERHFWQQIQRFPSASYIYVGTEQAQFSGAEQVAGGRPHVAFWSGKSPDRTFQTYATDEQGKRQNLISKVENYDLLKRPWYNAAKAAQRAVWGNVYVWSAPYANLALPAVYPFYNSQGRLAAVFAVDLSLRDIQTFLSSLEVSTRGEVFILERNGLLVSSSIAAPLFAEVNGEQQRLPAMQSQSSLIRGTTQFLTQEFGNLAGIDQPQQLSFKLNGERQLLQVTPYRDDFGIDWLIAVVIPEADFMQQINANTRNTVLLCLVALGLAIGTGYLTARRISRPLLHLAQAVNQLSQGNLNQRVKPSAITEVDTLAKSFNSMAGQLQESFNALKRSEERFRSLVDNVPGAIYRGYYDADWTMEYISNEIEAISGYPASDFIQNQVRTYNSVIHADDRDLMEVIINHGIATQEPYILDYRVLHRDGSIRWVYEQGQAVFDDNDNLLHLDGAIFDITERKAAAEALKQSEVTNRALVDAIPDLLLRVRRDGTYLGEPVGSHRLRKFSEGKTVQESLPPKQAQQRIAAIEKTLQTGELQVYEHQLIFNGEPVDEEIRVVVIGEDEVLIMVRDITSRKRAEEALRIAEENYRSIFENAVEGIFQSTPEGKYINVNPALAKIYGYDSPAEMIASITNIGEQLYVDSEKRTEFKQLLELQDTVKQFEYRSYCKDGSIIWTQIDARVVRDNNGNVLYYEGIVQDITERKQREDELRRQLEELQVEIDQKKREEDVATLTKSSYFQEVQRELAEINLDEFWS
jgi:PAS domain S-box-containing protein